jgi:hypothetical protein
MQHDLPSARPAATSLPNRVKAQSKFFFCFVSRNAEHYVTGNHLSSVSGRTWWQIKQCLPKSKGKSFLFLFLFFVSWVAFYEGALSFFIII